MGTITARVYRGGVEVAAGDDVDPVGELDSDPEAIVWVDVENPTPDDLAPLAKQLSLHPLAVEDAAEKHQRDKWVHYPEHLFIVSHGVVLDVDDAELRAIEVDAFVGDRWLVTVHRDAADVSERVARRRERLPEASDAGIGFLLYALLADMVDGYFEVLDAFEAYYDEAAERVFADEPIDHDDRRTWFQMRRALTRFDRIVTPLRDGLGSLVRDDLDRFPPAAAPYLRDVESEVRRAAHEVDALRELVGQITEVNVSVRDLRQNVVMKRVTSWAAIIAVPTLVTGWYGMNLPYPGSQQEWGVVVAAVLSLGVSGTLYVLFKRSEWL